MEGDRLEQLSRIPLFSLLAANELEELLGVCEDVLLESGAVVFSAGDPGDSFYIVLSGHAKAWSGGLDGGLVGEFGPGDVMVAGANRCRVKDGIFTIHNRIPLSLVARRCREPVL